MAMFGKDIDTLEDLFKHTLKTTYYAERRITEALPKMIDKATSPELKQGLQTHLRETEGQIGRLEQVFQKNGWQAETLTCPAIDGILKAADSEAGDISDKAVLDAAIASGCQMVEHYEIAQYGSMVAWARQLGRGECADLLSATLAEEKHADEVLTRAAESGLNQAAQARAA